MSGYTDSPEYKQGTNVQRKTATWLTRRWKYVVARVNDDTAVAPMLEAWGRQVPLPDLQLMRPDGSLLWCDVKYKTCAVEFHVARVRRTGIDASAHSNYERVEALTGRPVYLLFVHRDENEVRRARVGQDAVRGVGVGQGMVYWDYDRLPIVGTYSEIDRTLIDDSQIRREPLFAPATNLQSRIPGMEAA